MQKIDISSATKFSDLSLDEFNRQKFSVYVIDREWNYLFVNNFVKQNLAERSVGLEGKNMWEHFRELALDPAFLRMKADIEKGKQINFITTSPLNNQRLSIVGHPLNDCYFFYTSVLPKKDDLMSELRAELEKR